MVRLLAVSALVLGMHSLTASSPVESMKDTVPTKPGVVSFTIKSDYQKGPNQLEVLCPDGMALDKKYPVLIVLPVNTGLDGQWGSPIAELRKLNIHNLYQVICVVPTYDAEPWYGDLPQAPTEGKPFIRQQAYVTEVLLPLLEKEFPVSAAAADRYLIGFSKSGFGAMGLILRNPDLFHRAAVYDCADPTPKADIFHTWGMVVSYGSRENFDTNFHIPTLIGKQKDNFKGPDRRIALLAGSLSYGGVEAIHQAMKDNKVAYQYTVFPGMGHSWNAGWLKAACAAILPNPTGTL